MDTVSSIDIGEGRDTCEDGDGLGGERNVVDDVFLKTSAIKNIDRKHLNATGGEGLRNLAVQGSCRLFPVLAWRHGREE